MDPPGSAHTARFTQVPVHLDLDVDGLCAWVAVNLAVDGATVTLVDTEARPGVTWTTDPVGIEVVALDLTVGDGPCSLARRSRRPVLLADLHGAETGWSPFTAEIVHFGVRALFAFPLLAGEECIGTLSLHRRAPGPLADGGPGLAAAVAERAVDAVFGTLAAGDEWAGLPTSRWDPVHQATGMVMAQLGLRPDEALLRLRSHAFRTGRPLLSVATDVISFDLVFFPGPPAG